MNRLRYQLTTSPVTDEARKPPEATAAVVSEVPGMVEVCCEGFLPGEDVAVAVISRDISAGPDGHAHALVETVKLGAPGEVILFGRISGTTVIRSAP